MLIFGRGQLGPHLPWMLAAGVLAVLGCGWYAVECAAAGELLPGSSRPGLALGVAGGLLIAFEMLIWPRKRWPGARTWPLGRTKTWMRAHIWLGLLIAPFALVHTGFRWGGPLPAATSIVLILVLLSGVWGLVLQNLLPRQLLAEVPGETPFAEIDRVVASHMAAFEEQLRVDAGDLGAAPKPGAEIVLTLYSEEAKPFLVGSAPDSELATAPRAAVAFVGWRERTPAAARPRLDELRELCDLRRNLVAQARLHWWLHNWVWVHLPLSVALCILLVAHIYTALKYQ